MRAALIDYDDTVEVDLATDSEGSAYKAIRDAVGGLIEPFGALYGDEVTLYVNDDGIASGQRPNRAIYANSRMERARYLSQFERASFRAGDDGCVRKGDLYAILFGPIVAVGFDPETGRDRDLDDDELAMVLADFGECAPMGPYSGPEAALLVALASRLR